MARFGRAQPPAPSFSRRIVAPGLLTLSNLAANTGLGQGGQSGVFAAVIDTAGQLVGIVSGLTVDGSNNLLVSSGVLAAGTLYHGYVFTLTGSGTMLQGVFQATAT